MVHEITQQDFHDYLDGRLDETDRARIACYLASHPEKAAELESYRAQMAGLHALYDSIADEPVPAAMAALLRRQRRRERFRTAARAVAAVLLLLASGAGGWWLAALPSPDLAKVAGFVAEAEQAYRLYADDNIWPSDFADRHTAALTPLLSQRLGLPVTLPEMGAAGFMPLSVRLMPTPSGDAAAILYRDGRGRAAVLLVSPIGAPDAELQRADEGGLTTLYRIKGHVGYAFTLDSGAVDGKIPAALQSGRS